MKKILLILLLTICSTPAWADGYNWFMDGGLYFRIISEEDGTAGLSMPYNTAEVPNAVTEANAYLNSLTELYVPATAADISTGRKYKVTTVFNDVICKRAGLERVEFANGIEHIEGLSDCSRLKEITLPESLVSIKGVSQHPELKTLELPYGLAEIGEYTVSETGIRKLVIPSTVLTLGIGAVLNNNELAEINLGNVELFQHHSLGILPAIKRIVFPNTSFEAQYYTLEAQNIEEIWIGDKATDNPAMICSQGIIAGKSLKKVYCARTVPPTITEQNPMFDPACFGGEAHWPDITLYVPVGCKDVYARAYCFKDMKIEEYDFGAGISSAECNANSIQAIPGGIRYVGDAAAPVAVYTASGTRIALEAMRSGEVMQLPSGIFIVSCNGNNTKVTIR